jgi:hypothetical protein
VRALRVAALGAVSLSLLAAGAEASAKTVHIRGTAYEFNNTDTLLGGATIRVAEYPRVRARTRRNGTYDLAVPDHASVTPYIVAAGHHTIYLQTFRTAGEDLDRVNFQTPTDSIYRALAALLNVPLDQTGEIRECAIVSTFSTRNVRDLGYRQFTGYGAHGVAGATAFASPSLPAPIYFNDDVIPDPAQPRSSIDGGVIWTRVPTGVYRLRARHSSTRFASFVATCRPGRVVNANPPWGFHELGQAMPATLTTRWVGGGGEARLRRLRVTKLPPGARVRISCAGPDCSFRRRAVSKPGGGSLDVLDALGLPAPVLRARQHIDVLVTAHAYDGKLVRWRLRKTGALRSSTLCVPLGNTKPRRC